MRHTAVCVSAGRCGNINIANKFSESAGKDTDNRNDIQKEIPSSLSSGNVGAECLIVRFAV